MQLQHLALTRLQQPGLAKRRQHLGRVAQHAARQRQIALRHLPARRAAHVLHFHGNLDRIALALRLRLHFKLRVAQAKSEGIQRLFLRKRLKIAVADVDVLHIGVGGLAAKIRAAGVVLVLARDGVRQPAAGVDLAAQHVRRRVAALHAALPGVHDGVQLVAVVLHPAHVDHVAAVHHHAHLVKARSHQIQHVLFIVRQVEAARLQQVLAVLARRAADHHQRRVAVLRRLRNDALVQRHLGVAHGPLAPGVLVRQVAGDGAPLRVALGQLLGHLHAVLAQALHQAGAIGRDHVAAAAVAHHERVHRAAAEHRNGLLRAQGQQAALVLEQHDAVGGHLPRHRHDLRHRQLARHRDHRVEILFQTRAHQLQLVIIVHTSQHLSVRARPNLTITDI